MDYDEDLNPVTTEAKNKDVIDLPLKNGFDINMQNEETGDTVLNHRQFYRAVNPTVIYTTSCANSDFNSYQVKDGRKLIFRPLN